jgi:co-chaperonin GroES (HSP10)
MLKAIAHRIIIKPDPVEEVTSSGIVLATNKKLEQGATVIGTIVDIGEDAWKAFKPRTAYAGLNIGDRVFYAKYAGKMIQEDPQNEDEIYLVVNDEDIVCKVI